MEDRETAPWLERKGCPSEPRCVDSVAAKETVSATQQKIVKLLNMLMSLFRNRGT